MKARKDVLRRTKTTAARNALEKRSSRQEALPFEPLLLGREGLRKESIWREQVGVREETYIVHSDRKECSLDCA